MAMKASLKAAWLKRLRTGRKATGKLRKERGAMCCLGHLGQVAGEKWDVEGREGWRLDRSSIALTPRLLRKYGITQHQQENLTQLNDTTTGFGKVMEYIKRNVRVAKPRKVAR